MRTWDKDYNYTLKLIEEFGSPIHVYDAQFIRKQADLYSSALGKIGSSQIRNFYAVKALPNPKILEILYKEGMGFDCSSLPEIHLAQMAGAQGEDMIFTSNNTSDEEFDEAVKAGAMINFDDLSLVERFLSQDRPTLPIAFCRYNPGDIEFDGVNQDIIGKPSEAKYGMSKEDIVEAYRQLSASGVKRFGLHTMLLSNERDYKNHIRIAQAMFELAKDITDSLGIKFEMINLGGGFGVAYRPDEKDFDIENFGKELADLYEKMDMPSAGSPQIITENGRWVTADAGYLLTRVINRKDTHQKYVGVDANMANLMRPGMYDAYHHVTILSGRKDFDPEQTETVNVVGSLCENNDQFAKDRELPKSQIGDIVAIHTTGAHGHAMGFQYNAKLRSAEVLIDGNKASLIRRAEVESDYFATITGLKEKSIDV